MDPFDEFLREHPLTDSVDVLLPDLAGVLRGKRLPGRCRASRHRRRGLFHHHRLFDRHAGCQRGGERAGLGGGRRRPASGASIRAPSGPCHGGPAAPRCSAAWRRPTAAPSSPTVRALVARLAERFAAVGLRPVAALEFEFYLIDATGGEQGAPLVPRSDRLDRRPSETEVFAPERMEDQERVLRAGRALLRGAGAADQGCLVRVRAGSVRDQSRPCRRHGVGRRPGRAMLKRCIKAAARATGQRATFMAKPYRRPERQRPAHPSQPARWPGPQPVRRDARRRAAAAATRSAACRT